MTLPARALSALAFVVFVRFLLPGGAAQAQQTKVATFAGGCFWCLESDFDHVPGVIETITGYTGGHAGSPTYEKVSAGGTGHYEAVRITYNPARVTYDQLLTAFWHSVDPVDGGGQFCDRGQTYSTAVFVDDEKDRQRAKASQALAETELGQKIVTPIIDAGPFYAAEAYHQGYAKSHPLNYKLARWTCGRNARVKELWGSSAYKGIHKG